MSPPVSFDRRSVDRRLPGWIAVLSLVTLTIAVVVHPGPLPGEIPYVGWLQRLGEPVPSLAGFVRSTTGTEGSIVVGLIPGVWLVRRYGRAGLRAVLIALFALLVVQPLYKEVVDRPRPDATQVEVRAVHTSKSFPSGHSLGTTVVWGTLAAVAWQRRHRAVAVAAAVPIVATGFSSGVQGVHWPTDAIAGTLVGLLTAGVIAHTIGLSPLPTHSG